MKNLALLNEVRRLAQGIEDENFKRVYKSQVNPILESYRVGMSDGVMVFEIKKAIKKIHHAAKSSQYVANCPPNRKNYQDPDFSEHSKLLAVEKKCEEILREEFREVV